MRNVLILLTLCIAAGCAGQVQKIQTGILGKWKYLGTDMPECHVTFKENGECTTQYFYGDGTDSIVEKYSIDGQKIKLFLLVEDFGERKIYSPDDTDFVEFEFELSGDTLIIKNRVFKKTRIFGEQAKMEYLDAVYVRAEQLSKTFDEGARSVPIKPACLCIVNAGQAFSRLYPARHKPCIYSTTNYI